MRLLPPPIRGRKHASVSRPTSPARLTSQLLQLCADPNVEVIYVATPHQHHAEHVRLATAQGKHVLVEKPIALTIADSEAMIAAARAAGVHLIVGHSHSFDAPVLRTRALIDSGAYGAVRMITAFNYTDYLYRPRRPEELDTAQGGGALFNQAPHQVDIVRLLGGGRVASVRAMTGAWDTARPTEGAYAALLTFENGAFASLSYSGYGHFDSDEFVDWIGELGQKKEPRAAPAPRRFADQTQESAAKAARSYGGADWKPAKMAKPPASALRYDPGELRTRRLAAATDGRHDLFEWRRPARRAATAGDSARRGDRRTLCGRHRRASAPA